MYNIYKHQENVRYEQSQRLKDQTYTKWLIRHEQLKNRSSENMKKRVSQFVQKQLVDPSIVQDDHYKTWRYNKQFRDVEDSNKFIGFKTFRHKPDYEIGRHFNQRQRKQISYLAQKSKMLVNQELIHQQLKSRSLRSQGPLAPKHTYRQKKPDHELLQPRMRYTNITDKERFMQTSLTYDNKFSKVYNGFSLNKSKIGSTKISPLKSGLKQNNIDMMSSTFSQHGKKPRQNFYFSVDNQQDKQLATSKYQNFNGSKLVPESSLSKEKKQKSYFKTAKTMALYGDNKAHNLMVETQYDRKKDLTNINKNINNQSFIKRPIL